jgi:hypothetical protein
MADYSPTEAAVRAGVDLVVEASADGGAFRGATFTEIGPVELKGVPEPGQLLSAHRAN